VVFTLNGALVKILTGEPWSISWGPHLWGMCCGFFLMVSGFTRRRGGVVASFGRNKGKDEDESGLGGLG